MRRDLASVMVALSSALLFVSTGQAQAFVIGSKSYVLRSEVVTVDSGATGDAQVLCNGSDAATGGGLVTGASEGFPPKMTVSDSFAISDASGEPPADNADPHGWRVIVFNPTPDNLDLQALVVCLASEFPLPIWPLPSTWPLP